jgi:hypothetical protein
LSGPAITVTAIVPAPAQVCVAWVDYPALAGRDRAHDQHAITSSPSKRMVSLLVCVAVG